MKGSVPARRPRVIHRPAQSAQAPPPPHLRHYKHVYWMLNGGPLVTAYRAVVLHDGCSGCAVCDGTTDWFMEFARIAKKLLGINLRDCLHWGPLHDSPRPLIAPASNLDVCNRTTLERLRRGDYPLPGAGRPRLERVPPAPPRGPPG